MTTPHDQAIREAANSLVEYGQTVGAFDRADVAGRAIESILRDLVAKAVADDHKRFADSCRGELVDLRAQLTAAQDEVTRLREADEKLRAWTDPDAGLNPFCGRCAVCGCAEPYTYHVPEALWRRVLPEKLWNEIVCARCFHETATGNSLRAAAEQAKGALEEARQRLDHNIPHHAYGDNQAAVEMSARIDEADGNLLSVLTALSAALTRHP